MPIPKNWPPINEEILINPNENKVKMKEKIHILKINWKN